MAERITNGYKRLFEIRLLHHYWLDEWQVVFDLITGQAKRDARLLKYDMRSFLGLRPTAATEKAFKGWGGVCKSTALGCIVAVPNSAVISADVTFEFVVTIQNAVVIDYTALTLRPQRIYELYHETEKRIYRYKENVPVLSNLTGALRGTAPNRALFLSTEIPSLAADDQVEALVLTGNALIQLTGDQPGAGTQQLGASAKALPVFVHQGDIPVLVPPNGLLGTPARGIQLTDDIPDTIFALIRLAAIRPDDNEFSLINASGHTKSPHPVFQIRFKNRSTIWRYIDKRTGAVHSTEPNPLPLTYFGNAGTKRKPSEGVVKAIKTGTKISQLVSDIYV